MNVFVFEHFPCLFLSVNYLANAVVKYVSKDGVFELGTSICLQTHSSFHVGHESLSCGDHKIALH